MKKLAVVLFVFVALAQVVLADGGNYRLYQGLTLYVHNPAGKAFDVELTLRDLNLFSRGPREVLFKVYDPDGGTPVREYIPDDGVAGKGFLPRLGGWDHEVWYYTLCYTRGTKPMFPWSAFSDPEFLKRAPTRVFQKAIPGGRKGVYRIVLAGTRDHYVGVNLSEDLRIVVSGGHTWTHGTGGMFRKSYVYVPHNVYRMHFGIMEMDPPQTRRFTLKAPDGKVLYDGPADSGFQSMWFQDGMAAYGGKLLTLEVTEGPGDFMVTGMFNYLTRTPANADDRPRGNHCLMTLAPDAATALAVKGGTIEHDGVTFQHMWQVRFHEWLKTLKPEDMVVRNVKGEVVTPTATGATYGKGSVRALKYEGLNEDGFFRLNGMHEAPPLCDLLMNHYVKGGRDRGTLSAAMPDLHRQLMSMSSNDAMLDNDWTNLGYVMGTYSHHEWRAAWRILRESDAADEVKAIIREALIMAGDRMAFGTGIERCNGNAFFHVVNALKYISEATQDEKQLARFDVFFDRFVNQGWGEGTGISKSGDLQEHFAHDMHYGSYILATILAPIADFKGGEFRPIYNRLRTLYSYVYSPFASANPWSSRTANTLSGHVWAEDGYDATKYRARDLGDGRAMQLAWKGEPGPDFTVSVNDGDEWFAARRKNYYAVTFHGRLAPMWLVNGFYGQIGFGGGILCQLSVPGKGMLFHSSLAGGYGKGMGLDNWRDFNIHSVVGTLAHGRPFVAGVSEHFNAKLAGNVVESSGEVRDRPVRVTRRYTFGPKDVLVEAELAPSGFTPLVTLWAPDRRKTIGMMREAWEMIPYGYGGNTVAHHRAALDKGDVPPVAVELLDKDGAKLADLSENLVENVQTIHVKRQGAFSVSPDFRPLYDPAGGGYGAYIRLAAPTAVRKGNKDTILIRLIDGDTPPADIKVSYRIEPYGN